MTLIKHNSCQSELREKSGQVVEDLFVVKIEKTFRQAINDRFQRGVVILAQAGILKLHANLVKALRFPIKLGMTLCYGNVIPTSIYLKILILG
ncbi:hypothetical protein QF042_002229 [Pedobacter sp. W3I1]|nr:hypothetical protein [Pedobacter sp. W3I1]